MRWLPALACVLLALAATPGAPASPPAAADCAPERVPALGQACLRRDGHYEVVLPDGLRLRTHGPDPLPPPGDVGFDLDDEQRPPVCAEGSRMVVLYSHASGSANRLPDLLDDFQAAVRRMNAVLNADALESGDVTADYKVKCDAKGDILIEAVPVSSGGGAAYVDDFDAIVAAARSAGHKAAETDYLIFHDGDSDGVCGVGNLAGDSRLSADNENMKGPDYGVAYKSCWFSRTPMHENGHNQGAVQDLAPDWDLTGHCLEGKDVMCYPTSSFLVLCSDRVHFDCDHDTYFDAEPEPGEWLATHWNIGARINRYIAFDYVAPPPPPAPAPAQEPQPDPEPEPTAEPEPGPEPEPEPEPATNMTSSPPPATGGKAADRRPAGPPAAPAERSPAAAWAGVAGLAAAAVARRRLLP